MSYPGIIKEAALERLFHTDLSLRHIADELGIPRATLHGWKIKTPHSGGVHQYLCLNLSYFSRLLNPTKPISAAPNSQIAAGRGIADTS